MLERVLTAFRFDQWPDALGTATLTTLIAMGPMTLDGHMESREWWAVCLMFGTTFCTYMKEHKAKAWDGVDRRAEGPKA